MDREKFFPYQPFRLDDPSRWDYNQWALCAYMDYRFNGGKDLPLTLFEDYAKAIMICYLKDMFEEENQVPSPGRWFLYVQKCQDLELRMRKAGIRNLQNEITMGHFLLNRTIEAMPRDLRRMPQRL